MPRTTLYVPLDLDNPVEARIADAVRSCPPHARHLAVVEALGIGLALHGLEGVHSTPNPVPVVVTPDPSPVGSCESEGTIHQSLEDFMSSFRC